MVLLDKPISMSDSKRHIKDYIKTKRVVVQKTTVKGKKCEGLLETKNRLPNDLPRHREVAKFSLLTGYDYLLKRPHRIDVATDPFCILCDSG